MYSSLARRQALACAIVFFFTLGLRLALHPWLSIPHPTIHDEFSYLLAGDTYAHGRLANPTPLLWEHFETFQVMQKPTYSSKYQPLQGMVLAFGEKLFGQPWAGVLLSSSLMCAAICWMLQAWIAPEWALLGALLFAVRIGVLSYWMNSYEGGAAPAIGGALALGAVGRIGFRGAYAQSAIWAAGLAIVMLSRPYDAAVIGFASAATLVWLLYKAGVSFGTIFGRIALPALAVFGLACAFMAYNNLQVTGSPLTLPYLAHDRQYAVASMFSLVPLKPEPVYRHAVMRDFWAAWNVGQWTDSRTAPVAQFIGKAWTLGNFFFGFWPVMVPLLLWPFALKSVQERLTIGLALADLLSAAVLIGVLPHYAAAFAGVFYLRFLQGLSRLANWRRPVGALAAAGITLLLIGTGRDSMSRALAARGAGFGADRDAIVQRLSAMPGPQLVLVRYAPSHDLQQEWVYNNAAFETSKVVWAREMNSQQDLKFIEHFRDRQAWLLEPDATPPRLTPYPAPKLEEALP